MAGPVHLRRGRLPAAPARVGLVDGHRFAAGALTALQRESGPLDRAQQDLLVTATRQWCRLLARTARTPLGQPSRAVADHWRLLAAHGGPEHDAFCASVLGHRVPGQLARRAAAQAPAAAPTGRPEPASPGAVALHAAYLLACADEGRPPPHLPLLFRVDWALDRLDARTYVPNCGEVRYCAAPEGTTCLQHLATRPRRRSRWGGAPAGGIGMRGDGALGGYAG